MYWLSVLLEAISIHAPARGATSINSSMSYSSDISIHAPARGATMYSDVFSGSFDISIHAPARGATILAIFSGYSIIDFNPRSREGSDGSAGGLETEYNNFNPRSREGSDNNDCVRACRKRKFQSTLPRGERRPYYNTKPASKTISIHAPARGATAYLDKFLEDLAFQSTLPRGERRPEIFGYSQFLFISIHAPARGATER